MPGYKAQVVLLLLLSFQSLANGYKTGAPVSTCYTRYPKHQGIGTQSTSCPFLISFSPANYTPGTDITVTIKEPNNSDWFTGIEIAAFRDTGNPEEIVGRFINYPADKLKPVTCFSGYQNMLTHINNIKIQTLSLKWRAPSENVGHITFKATIVANYETFWTGVEAKLLAASTDHVAGVEYQRIIVSQLTKDVDLSTCGESKGCFLYPRHCARDDCVAAVTFRYQDSSDDYMFELFSSVHENYISLGFSDDKEMGHDETVTCTGYSGQVGIQHGWNPSKHNERMLTRWISEVKVRQVDGHLHCQFVLPRKSSVYKINQAAPAYEYENITYDRENAYYLQLAWGKVMPDSDVMSFHKDMPATSSNMVSLKEKSIYRGTAFHVLVQMHASFMMIAWIFLSGLVTVVSRHYRNWLPRRRWFGTKVWFQIHRELAIVIAVLTAMGMVLIFAHYGAILREQAGAHAYVGIAVTATLGLQLIAGFLRPGPESKKRIYFNWGHRLLGQTTHILAAVTMFLAYDIDYITNDMRVLGFAVLGVWVVVQIIWHIVFEILACREGSAGQNGGAAWFGSHWQYPNDPLELQDKKKKSHWLCPKDTQELRDKKKTVTEWDYLS